ncbi:MAG: hypothetical protein Q9224_007186 [Gallowayella concinna]
MTVSGEKSVKYKLNRKNCKHKYIIDSNDSDSEKEGTMGKVTQKYLEPVFHKYEVAQYDSTLHKIYREGPEDSDKSEYPDPVNTFNKFVSMMDYPEAMNTDMSE